MAGKGKDKGQDKGQDKEHDAYDDGQPALGMQENG